MVLWDQKHEPSFRKYLGNSNLAGKLLKSEEVSKNRRYTLAHGFQKGSGGADAPQ